MADDGSATEDAKPADENAQTLWQCESTIDGIAPTKSSLLLRGRLCSRLFRRYTLSVFGCGSAMRLSVEHNTEAQTPRLQRPVTPDPAAPDLSFLTRDVADGVAILLRHHRSHLGRQPRGDRAIAGTGRQGASRASSTEADARSSSRSSCRRSVRAARSARRSASFSSSSPIRCWRRSAGRAPSFNHRSVPCSSSTATPSATCSSATRSSRSSPTASR